MGDIDYCEMRVLEILFQAFHSHICGWYLQNSGETPMRERQRVTDLLFRDLVGLRTLATKGGDVESNQNWYKQWAIALDVLHHSQDSWINTAKHFVDMRGSWVNTVSPPSPEFIKKFYTMCQEAS